MFFQFTEDAKELFRTKDVTVSQLQRKLNITYTNAFHLLENLEEAGLLKMVEGGLRERKLSYILHSFFKTSRL